LGRGWDVYCHKSSAQIQVELDLRKGSLNFFSRARNLNKVLSVNVFKFYNRLQVQNVDCFVGRKPIYLLEVNHFFPSGVGVKAHVTEFTCGLKYWSNVGTSQW